MIMLSMLTRAQESVTFELNLLGNWCQVSPETNFLIGGIPNQVKIQTLAGFVITDTLVVDGSFESQNGCLHLLPQEKTLKLMLLGKDERGKAVSFEKDYQVAPEPSLTVGNIACDSTGNIFDLLLDANLHVAPKRYGLDVQGFDLEFVADGKLHVLNATGSFFTRSMRDALYKAPDGTLLQFSNIQIGPHFSEVILPTCQIYLTTMEPPKHYTTGVNMVIKK